MVSLEDEINQTLDNVDSLNEHYLQRVHEITQRKSNMRTDNKTKDGETIGIPTRKEGQVLAGQPYTVVRDDDVVEEKAEEIRVFETDNEDDDDDDDDRSDTEDQGNKIPDIWGGGGGGLMGHSLFLKELKSILGTQSAKNEKNMRYIRRSKKRTQGGEAKKKDDESDQFRRTTSMSSSANILMKGPPSFVAEKKSLLGELLQAKIQPPKQIKALDDSDQESRC
eukprot:TRINITY_DN2665_c0_g1_i2.p1 TRINITY_DN2665_c0_g1~~TRINITY_DN2665_c0_g1_i2.p1  ORF type:complete len:223 (+),score=51.31 TRINITY_DN2665_c0_g1_i2:410-1078(+)